jgi:hypothetical protein
MSAAKLLTVAGIAAFVLSACGTSAKPVAGSVTATVKPASRGRIDDPRTTKNNHVLCLQRDHLSVVEHGSSDLQIGPPGIGPYVHFEPTPGIAQGAQIGGKGQYQGAEVIGSALLYTNQASDRELAQVEACLAVGVTG